MIRPPPTSTLFSYTTLFRSFPNGDSPFGRLYQHGDLAHVATLGQFKIRQLATMAALDRKSTRLNSSHSQISYAVFCLKKKSNCPRRLCAFSYHSHISAYDSG